MTVVRNEMEMGENSPARVLQSRLASMSFLWHNYGNSTIGARSDVENVPIERLQAFYRRYYQPDNAVLVIAGFMVAISKEVNHTVGADNNPTMSDDLAVTGELDNKEEEARDQEWLDDADVEHNE